MDPLQHFLGQAQFKARHLFSDTICGRSPTYYAGSVGYIHFFRGGKLTVIPDDRESYTLTEPTLIFCPGSWPHRLHGDETLGALMRCSVLDSDTGMRRAMEAVLPRVLVIPVGKLPALHTTLDLLIAEADGKKLGWKLACDRLFEYLVAQILRWAVETGVINQTAMTGFGDPKLARSLAALHSDMTQDWTLENLAALAGMSRSSYAARFSAIMGITPAEYILNLRVSAAKHLLLQGVPVKTAALETGFSAPAVFTRAFRRKVGASPLEWLRRQELTR